MSIGWGIVGIGKHADRAMAPGIKKAANADLVAVCSRDKGRADAFATKHGAQRAYDSLDKMLNDPAIEAIYIATPNSLHAAQTIQAAEAGKHVLCEKPMALTVDDARRMIESCDRHGVKLGVVFQNRYHPAHVEARRLILAGMVGQITLATAQYCHGFLDRHWQGWRADLEMAGGAALMGTGLHPIDLLRFLVGSEVSEVWAHNHAESPANSLEDMVYVTLEFENGAHGVVISGIRVPRSHNDVVVYGTRARIRGAGTVGMPLQGELLVDSDTFHTRTTFPCDDPMPANYTCQVEEFNRCIAEGSEPRATGWDGLEMVRLADAILESSRLGRSIKLAR